MGSADEHPLIAFADRYGDPSLDYLNAYMAIARLEVLLEDLGGITRLLERDMPVEKRWAPWFGAEIMSYYAVGFATCLEWHAKSRLVDLLTFRPSALRLADVQKTIGDKIIVQMVAKQASVIQLVGAALKVSDLRAYLGVIERVFKELEVPCSVVDWLAGQTDDATVCWLRPGQLGEVSRMFEFRHALVHEIGIATMGHPNVRDSWSPKEARHIGRIVCSLMSGIEAAFTRYAPRLFPNLLTEERYPIGSAEQLKEELSRLDGIVDAHILSDEWKNDRTADDWKAARSKFSEYLEAEENFVSSAGMLHWRYFDARTPLRVKLISYRISFLSDLLSNFASDDGEVPATSKLYNR